MTYNISIRNADMKTYTTLSADEIIAMLDQEIPLQQAHAQAVREIVKTGARYSYHDIDVLGSAWRVAVEGRTEVHSYEAKWVERMCAIG